MMNCNANLGDPITYAAKQPVTPADFSRFGRDDTVVLLIVRLAEVAVADIINVVDISHHNGNVNFGKVAEAGILGVIHKASQGQTGRDPTYKGNRRKAEEAGLFWGAYHFATGSDGIRQADNFVEAVGDLDKVLLVLDFEPNPTGPSMSLEEAR